MMAKIILNVSESDLTKLKRLLLLYQTNNYVSAILQAIFEVVRYGRPTKEPEKSK